MIDDWRDRLRIVSNATLVSEMTERRQHSLLRVAEQIARIQLV